MEDKKDYGRVSKKIEELIYFTEEKVRQSKYDEIAYAKFYRGFLQYKDKLKKEITNAIERIER